MKYCAKCGCEMPEGTTVCPRCGAAAANASAAVKKPPTTVLYVIAACLYAMSLFMFFKGWDKMTHYHNSESYPSFNVNAYVGGDAYNYIINGNYATGFFVLGSGFFLSGSVLLCTGLVLNQLAAQPQGVTVVARPPERPEPISEELPEL